MATEQIFGKLKQEVLKQKATLLRSNPHIVKSVDALVDFSKGKRDRLFSASERLNISLTPVDRIFLGQGGYRTQFVCHFEHPMEKELIEASFEKALKDFWPLRSQLLYNDVNAFLVGAKSPIRLRFEKRDRLPCFKDPKEASHLDAKLNDQQLTEAFFIQTPKESLLSLAFPHFLGDGYSQFFFLTYWAAIARHLKENSLIPFNQPFNFPKLNRFSPHTLYSQAESQPEAPLEDSNVFFKDTGFFIASRRGNWKIGQANWHYLEYLKKDIDIEVKQCLKNGIKISHHDILAAKIWKKVAEVYHSNDNQELYNSSIVDYRRHFDVLGSRYFGNAIHSVGFSMQRSQILKSQEVDIAKCVRSHLQSVSVNGIARGLNRFQSVWERGSIRGMEHIHVSHPSRGLLVTNLSRIRVRTIDFGFGSPVEITSLTPAPRTAVVTYARGKYLVRLHL